MMVSFVIYVVACNTGLAESEIFGCFGNGGECESKDSFYSRNICWFYLEICIGLTQKYPMIL